MKKGKSSMWMGATNGTANPPSTAGKVKAKQNITLPKRGLQSDAASGFKGASKKAAVGKLGC